MIQMKCGPNLLRVVDGALFVNDFTIPNFQVDHLERSVIDKSQPFIASYVNKVIKKDTWWVNNAQDPIEEWTVNWDGLKDPNYKRAKEKPPWLVGVYSKPKVLVVNGDLQGDTQTGKERPKGRRQKAKKDVN